MVAWYFITILGFQLYVVLYLYCRGCVNIGSGDYIVRRGNLVLLSCDVGLFEYLSLTYIMLIFDFVY